MLLLTNSALNECPVLCNEKIKLTQKEPSMQANKAQYQHLHPANSAQPSCKRVSFVLGSALLQTDTSTSCVSFFAAVITH